MEKNEISFEELFDLKQEPVQEKLKAVEKRSYSTLEERLKLCQQCEHRAFSSESGLLCDITNRKPDFVLHCENFQVDENLRLKSMKAKPSGPTSFWVSKKPALVLSFLSLIKLLLKAYSNKLDYLGIFFLIIGIVWFLVAGSNQEEGREDN